MANYYIMSSENQAAFMEARDAAWIGWDAIENMTPSEVEAYDREVKAACDATLVNTPVIEGTKKAEIVAEACRRMEAQGKTEAHVVRVSFPKDCHTYTVEQSWYVFREAGKWFQKMKQDCKAKHEVCL